eukprot:TRINITY_DN33485_c0_g1_i1.p1 TRINITY_DN33485_c0_g1~~TRINITY_DN33485_c0_g1_i1.p1  ORF type:complete len:673 (+),score=122.49 TRINITY_DN33485_c0_g1_i1:24-2042(+)
MTAESLDGGSPTRHARRSTERAQEEIRKEVRLVLELELHKLSQKLVHVVSEDFRKYMAVHAADICHGDGRSRSLGRLGSRASRLSVRSVSPSSSRTGSWTLPQPCTVDQLKAHGGVLVNMKGRGEAWSNEVPQKIDENNLRSFGSAKVLLTVPSDDSPELPGVMNGSINEPPSPSMPSMPLDVHPQDAGSKSKGNDDAPVDAKAQEKIKARRARASRIAGFSNLDELHALAPQAVLDDEVQERDDFRSLWEQRFHDGDQSIGLSRIFAVGLGEAAGTEWFDYVMGALLIGNAIVIGLQTEHRATNGETSEMPFGFLIVDWFFCVAFFVELFLRAIHTGSVREFFCGSSWKWNLFDMFVVVFQWADQLIQLAAVGESNVLLEKLGLFRMLRLAKLVRLVRLVRLIPELQSMVYLILASMGSFFWTAVMLLLLMYMFAIYFTEVGLEVATSVFNGPGNEAELASLTAKWGSIGSSIMSLFQAISGGDDWVNFVAVLLPHPAGAAHMLVFCAWVAFATLVMLNLVTGVFVEGAHRIVRRDEDAEILKLALKLFFSSNLDRNYEITREEFDHLFESDLMQEYCRKIGFTIEQAEHLFMILDSNDSRSLSVTEFVKGCLWLRSPARAIDIAASSVRSELFFNQVMDGLQKLHGMIGSMSMEGSRRSEARDEMWEEAV